jgi:acylaminoacyl-peptidase
LDKEGRQKYLYQIPITVSPASSESESESESESSITTTSSLPPTLMDSTIQIRLPSPSGTKMMIVKQQQDDTTTTTTTTTKSTSTMELWEGDALTRRITASVDKKNDHGPIIDDATGFGIPTWSPDETCILYAAEQKAVKTKAFWKKNDNGKDEDEDEGTVRGGQNVLGQGTLEDWGEKLSKQSPLLDLYILNVDTGKRERVANVPSTEVTLGQAVWHPDGKTIAYTGWDAGGLGNMARRLGMIFCRNRASKIYTSDVTKLLERLQPGNDDDDDDDDDDNTGEEKAKEEDTDFICVTPDFPFARSPQFAQLKDGTPSLVFLANPKGFVSHDGCMGLYQSKSSDGESVDCVVPVVEIPDKDAPTSLHGMGFPGLFLSQLPSACGCGQGYIFTTTVWGSFQRIVRIDLSTGAVHLVEVEGFSPLASQSLLCKASENGGSWVISEVASNQPARIWRVQGLLEDAESGIVRAKARLVFEFSSMAVTSFSTVKPRFDVPIDLKVISIPPPKVEGVTSDTPIQALVMIPRRSEKVPLVVIPHGGPHSCTTSWYSPGFAYLASHYAVVFPNYRGSTGFGQTSLESLLTRIGEVDVQDVMACTHHVLKEEKDRIDSSRVGICGGSHGGFLTAHCTGQFPDFFRAAVMRNPVTNIASMVTATDIADWCYAEALGAYDASKFRGPTLEEMSAMYAKSPIVNAGKVKTPTLVGLGMVDLRVPPSQGKEWYHTLRSAGVDTQLLVYPEDCHALDKVTTEADHWIHVSRRV